MLGAIAFTVNQTDTILSQKDDRVDMMEVLQEEVPHTKPEEEEMESPEGNGKASTEEKTIRSAGVTFKKLLRFFSFFSVSEAIQESEENVSEAIQESEEVTIVGGVKEEKLLEETAAGEAETEISPERSLDNVSMEGSVPHVATGTTIPMEVVPFKAEVKRPIDSIDSPVQETQSPFRRFFLQEIFSSLHNRTSYIKPIEEESPEETAVKDEPNKSGENKELCTEETEEPTTDVTQVPQQEEDSKPEKSEGELTPDMAQATEEKERNSIKTELMDETCASERAVEEDAGSSSPETANTIKYAEDELEDDNEEETGSEDETPAMSFEAELLSSIEKTIKQIPFKRLLIGTCRKRLSSKHEGSEEDEEEAEAQLIPETQSDKHVMLQTSTKSCGESAEELVQMEAMSQTDEGEGKREKPDGILPWTSFKRLVSSTKQIKRSSGSEDEAENLICTDDEEDLKPSKEKYEIEMSTEEPKKKVHPSLSWEDLICLGSAKKRGKKYSDAEDARSKDVQKIVKESQIDSFMPSEKQQKGNEDDVADSVTAQEENIAQVALQDSCSFSLTAETKQPGVIVMTVPSQVLEVGTTCGSPEPIDIELIEEIHLEPLAEGFADVVQAIVTEIMSEDRTAKLETAQIADNMQEAEVKDIKNNMQEAEVKGIKNNMQEAEVKDIKNNMQEAEVKDIKNNIQEAETPANLLAEEQRKVQKENGIEKNIKIKTEEVRDLKESTDVEVVESIQEGEDNMVKHAEVAAENTPKPESEGQITKMPGEVVSAESEQVTVGCCIKEDDVKECEESTTCAHVLDTMVNIRSDIEAAMIYIAAAVHSVSESVEEKQTAPAKDQSRMTAAESFQGKVIPEANARTETHTMIPQKCVSMSDIINDKKYDEESDTIILEGEINIQERQDTKDFKDVAEEVVREGVPFQQADAEGDLRQSKSEDTEIKSELESAPQDFLPMEMPMEGGPFEIVPVRDASSQTDMVEVSQCHIEINKEVSSEGESCNSKTLGVPAERTPNVKVQIPVESKVGTTLESSLTPDKIQMTSMTADSQSQALEETVHHEQLKTVQKGEAEATDGDPDLLEDKKRRSSVHEEARAGVSQMPPEEPQQSMPAPGTDMTSVRDTIKDAQSLGTPHNATSQESGILEGSAAEHLTKSNGNEAELVQEKDQVAESPKGPLMECDPTPSYATVETTKQVTGENTG